MMKKKIVKMISNKKNYCFTYSLLYVQARGHTHMHTTMPSKTKTKNKKCY